MKFFGDLPVAAVESVDRFAMDTIGPRARGGIISDDAGKSKFVIYTPTEARVGSGGTETMLSVLRREEGLARYLVVSFLNLVFTDERRYSNEREAYFFNWCPDSKFAIGSFVVKDAYYGIVETKVSEQGDIIDVVVPKITIDSRPLSVDDCLDVRTRMLRVTQDTAA